MHALNLSDAVSPKDREYILGFVPLPAQRPIDAIWPAERRRLYLLRENAVAPISVSDLAHYPYRGIGDPEIVRLFGQTSVQTHDGASDSLISLPLWPDLAMLLHFCHTTLGDLVKGTYSIYAVTQVSSCPISKSYTSGFGQSRSVIEDAEAQWRRLGYDISNASGLSALQNCGYRSEVKIGQSFTMHLNGHHLFDDRTMANRFVEEIASHDLLHAPFHVSGIYVLRTALEKIDNV